MRLALSEKLLITRPSSSTALSTGEAIPLTTLSLFMETKSLSHGHRDDTRALIILVPLPARSLLVDTIFNKYKSTSRPKGVRCIQPSIPRIPKTSSNHQNSPVYTPSCCTCRQCNSSQSISFPRRLRSSRLVPSLCC